MTVAHSPGVALAPFEIVLDQDGRLAVTLLGAFTAPAARVLDDALDQLARDRDCQVTVDRSGAQRPAFIARPSSIGRVL